MENNESSKDGTMSKATIGKQIDQSTVESLIKTLGDEDGLVRHRARLSLVEMGHPVVPFLIDALQDDSDHRRWEAAKALSQIGDPAAAPALVGVLEDENFGVRWLAAEGLIAAGYEGLTPLLEALVRHSDSAWLREGAHHVLRTLAGDHGLHSELAAVLSALDDVEPVIEVPPAARKALGVLEEKASVPDRR
jgi:HEAT repeat protein